MPEENFQTKGMEEKIEERKEELNNQINEQIQPVKLDRNRKLAVIILAGFAFFIFIAWGKQFRNSINQPFTTEGILGNQETETEYAQEDSVASLRAKDTDQDGVNDYDELNIYYTSPYLADSDSDGFSDKEEIDSNNDPNCPMGRDCYVDEQELNSTNTQLEEASVDQSVSDVLSGEIDADSLRQILRESGMEEEVLSSFSDEELLKNYSEALSQASQ